MDNAAVLILTIAIIAVVTLLLIRTQSKGGSGEATFAIADIFTASIKINARDAATANAAVKEAASQRGTDDADPVASEQGELTRLARVLWVDDHPDNNVFETVALEKLGRFVTKATSTEAGLRYMAAMEFALVITDLGRGGAPDAGLDFIARARQAGHEPPVIVYTLNAERVRQKVLDAGGSAAVDRPDELIRDIEQRLASRVD